MKILAISDQHGHLPSVPSCDVLIVAGDVCPDVIGGVSARDKPERQLAWFRQDWLAWRRRLDARVCLVTWGNHDYGGEHLPHRTIEEGAQLTIVASDTLVTVPGSGLRVYLTPWSNTFMRWAFMRDPEVLAGYYSAIPSGVDILVSHQPPRGYGDQAHYQGEHFGSTELLRVIQTQRPRAVVCGHIHGGHGTYDCEGIPVYNVSVVNEGYALVHAPTEITLAEPVP